MVSSMSEQKVTEATTNAVCEEVKSNVTENKATETPVVDATVKSDSERQLYLGLSDELIAKKIEARKSISKFDAKNIAGITAMFERFSSLTDNDHTLGGIDLNRWPVSTWMKDFILPGKVCLSGENAEYDYIQHPAITEDEELPMSLAEWRDMCEYISQVLTKKPSQNTTLEEVKRTTLLTNVKNPSYNGKCRDDRNAPWPLNIHVYKDKMTGLNIEDVIEEVLQDALDHYKQ